jgi:hypothetical protein
MRISVEQIFNPSSGNLAGRPNVVVHLVTPSTLRAFTSHTDEALLQNKSVAFIAASCRRTAAAIVLLISNWFDQVSKIYGYNAQCVATQ